jgi:hypothetical protein
MHDVVVLGREFDMILTYQKGIEKEKDPTDLIVPVYWVCNIFQDKVYYNNKSTLAITNAQWGQIGGRISLVPPSVRKYTSQYGEIRVLPGVQNIRGVHINL